MLKYHLIVGLNIVGFCVRHWLDSLKRLTNTISSILGETASSNDEE